MSAEERKRATAGLAVFLALSFLGSWFVAAAFRLFGLSVAPTVLGTRLFTTSLLYAGAMGWQPIVATWVVRRWVDPPDQLDLGLRPARRAFGVGGVVAALALAFFATGVAAFGGAVGLFTMPSSMNGSAEGELTSIQPSGSAAIVLLGAFAGTILLVMTQAFAEEIGWRGYFLPRAMERLGKWRGLFAHGAVWGLWYAPILFFTGYGSLAPFATLSRSGGFVVTCVLLGTLFGWLRLASRSVVPVVMANATLTLAAGLPYVLHGVDGGLRSAAFGPPGWLVMIAAIGALLLSRWRFKVQTPARLLVSGAPDSTMLVRIHVALTGRRARDNELN